MRAPVSPGEDSLRRRREEGAGLGGRAVTSLGPPRGGCGAPWCSCLHGEVRGPCALTERPAWAAGSPPGLPEDASQLPFLQGVNPKENPQRYPPPHSAPNRELWSWDPKVQITRGLWRGVRGCRRKRETAFLHLRPLMPWMLPPDTLRPPGWIPICWEFNVQRGLKHLHKLPDLLKPPFY